MEKRRYFTVLIVGFTIAGALAYPAEEETHDVVGNSVNKKETTTRIQYPEARRDETVIDNYHGTEIKDPYRWLEDPNSEETKAFVDAQNALTTQFLLGSPARKKIKDTSQQLLDFSGVPFVVPTKHGNKYYFIKKGNYLKERRRIYVQDTLDSESKVYLDLDTFYKNETVGISDYVFSKDGKILALMLFRYDSNSFFIRFMNTETGIMYPEILEKIVNSKITWTNNSKGIFYGSSLKQAGMTQKVSDLKLFYHILGTERSKDVFVAKITGPCWQHICSIHAPVIDYGNRLLIVIQHSLYLHSVFLTKLSLNENITGELNLIEVFGMAKVSYEYVTNDGPNAIFLTNKNASNFQLISINLEDPAADKWRVLLPEHPDRHLNWVQAVDGDKFVACYIHYDKSILQLHSLKNGKFLRNIFLDNGIIFGHDGNKKYSEISFGFKSILTRGVIYAMDLAKDQKPKIYRQSELDKFYSQTHKMTQVYYPSKDGTRIPMTIVTRADAVLNGSAPTFLFLNVNLRVSMHTNMVAMSRILTEHFNGVWAIAGIRGSNDFVEDVWRNFIRKKNRTLVKKQTVLDDFQHAAKYLIENNYATPSKLLIVGNGHEGLDIAACINQRPDLFGAAIIEDGLMDMLRYHKLGSKLWLSNYGNPDDPKHFVNLLKYSPLHNVRPPPNGVQFPATLFMTSRMGYSQFPPLHTFKITAMLQHHIGKLTNQTNPILARIETEAPHGPSTNPIDDMVDILTFLAKTMGLTFRK